MTTSTLTLSAFLLARIEADEAVARAAQPGPWSFEDTGVGRSRVIYAGAPLPVAKCRLAAAGTSRHVARHDPARVLAECEAKRSVIALAEATIAQGMRITGGAILRVLAQPYAEHPDFRPEWRV